MVSISNSELQIDFREIDVDATRPAKDIRQDVHADVGDDLDDLRIAVTRVAHVGQLGGGDIAGVFDEGAGKPHGGGSPGVLAGAGTVGIDLGAIETDLATDRGVRRQAVFAGVVLCQCEGDAFAGLRVEAAAVGDAVQAEESLERCWRVGEHLEEVRDYAELGLDRVEKRFLFGVGGFVGDGVDAGHDVSPVRTAGLGVAVLSTVATLPEML